MTHSRGKGRLPSAGQQGPVLGKTRACELRSRGQRWKETPQNVTRNDFIFSPHIYMRVSLFPHFLSNKHLFLGK